MIMHSTFIVMLFRRDADNTSFPFPPVKVPLWARRGHFKISKKKLWVLFWRGVIRIWMSWNCCVVTAICDFVSLIGVCKS